jgi:hypothetical protein
MLARLHLAGCHYHLQQPHLRGLAGGSRTVPVVLPHLDPPRAALLHDELVFQQAWPVRPTPSRCRAARSTPTCSATT